MHHVSSSPEGDSRHAPVGTPPVSPLIWGALLILGGVLFLLLNLGFFASAGAWLVALFFAAPGLIFLYLLFKNPEHRWWASIPGMVLMGLAGTVLAGAYGGAWGAVFSGSLFLGSIGLGFLLILFVRRDFWWVIIPGGVLATLAIMTYLVTTGAINGAQGGAVLFLGIGVTFLLLIFFLPAGKGRWWPLLPAAGMILMGSMLYSDTIFYLARFDWAGPVVLIAVGCWLVYRALARQEHE